MLFATNRTPIQSARTKKGRKISFSMQNTSVRQDMYFCRRQGVDDYIELGSKDFFQTLKDLDGNTQILFYIHGFNNLGESDIFPNAEILQKMFDQLSPGLVYIVPLIWPCDDDSAIAFMDDYWDDQRASRASGDSFARMLGLFDNWRKEEAKKPNPCTRRINVLAHSMGNRVLRNAISSWVKYDMGGNMPQLFRNVFMVAADVVNHTLEFKEKGCYIPDSARNVVVYYANDDLAMPASKIANLKNMTASRRLGMTGPESMSEERLARNVYEVDCDDFNNSWGDRKGHTYFLKNSRGKISPVIYHMIDAIAGGRVKPAVRHHILEKP
ncbi:MAG: alpha/beta hydrolase [Psychromonas sp.]